MSNYKTKKNHKEINKVKKLVTILKISNKKIFVYVRPVESIVIFLFRKNTKINKK